MTGAAIKGTTGPTATGGAGAELGKAQRPDVAEQIPEPQRFPGAAQVLEYAASRRASPRATRPPEAHGRSGRELIAAVPLAYEVQAAWADSFHLASGGAWDQAACAAISAPLGAGKVIGLTMEQLAEALAGGQGGYDPSVLTRQCGRSS